VSTTIPQQEGQFDIFLEVTCTKDMSSTFRYNTRVSHYICAATSVLFDNSRYLAENKLWHLETNSQPSLQIFATTWTRQYLVSITIMHSILIAKKKKKKKKGIRLLTRN
jgi:hypothetical protein